MRIRHEKKIREKRNTHKNQDGCASLASFDNRLCCGTLASNPVLDPAVYHRREIMPWRLGGVDVEKKCRSGCRNLGERRK